MITLSNLLIFGRVFVLNIFLILFVIYSPCFTITKQTHVFPAKEYMMLNPLND